MKYCSMPVTISAAVLFFYLKIVPMLDSHGNKIAPWSGGGWNKAARFYSMYGPISAF
jgi:hypothetical protein